MLLVSLIKILENCIEGICKSNIAPLVFFKSIKIVGEAYSLELEPIKARYEAVAVRIWQYKKDECKDIGCELIRLTQNIARVPVNTMWVYDF